MTMTTKNGVQIICKDVNELLQDIFIFLTEEINKGNLSKNSKVNNLIERSKFQLQAIAKLKAGVNDEAYVDMKGNKDNGGGLKEEDSFYDQITDEIKSEAINIEYTGETQCPFADLPAKSLSGDKYGNIMLKTKTKFVFNLEKIKNMYAGIHENWFLIYYTAKDNKPYQTINLNEYSIRVDKQQIEQNKFIFELYNNKKSFHFTAITYKDLWQWITAIRKNSNQFFHHEEKLKQKESNVETDSFDDCEEDDDETYQTISEPSGVKRMNINNKMNISVPSLPPRTYKPKQRLPEVETISDSETDETYNQVAYPPTPVNKICNSKIEMEDDEDAIYNEVNDQSEDDEFYNLVKNSNVQQNIKQEDDEEEDEIYNSIDNSSMLQKPKKVDDEEEDEIYNVVDDSSIPQKPKEEEEDEDEIYNLVGTSSVSQKPKEEVDEEETYNLVGTSSVSQKPKEEVDEEETYNLVDTSNVLQKPNQKNYNELKETFKSNVNLRKERFSAIQKELERKSIIKPIVPPKVKPKPDIKTIPNSPNIQFTRNSSFLSRLSANKITNYSNNNN